LGEQSLASRKRTFRPTQRCVQWASGSELEHKLLIYLEAL